MKKADIALIGLAVMGENLVLNMESKGYTVAVYNRTSSKTDKFISGRGANKNFIGCHTLEELVAQLERPRKVMMLIKAGDAVDTLIDQLIPLLEPGDIIIDGGNSHFPDTIRRTKYVESKNLLYVGSGVSGGEEGALKGPSLMPGGSKDAWPHIKPIFQSIAAKVENEIPCCDWVGPDGAGHFIKMVHNGIEYGDMQIICEAYALMRDLLHLNHNEMYEIFDQWNKRDLDSYLIEITRDIMGYRDEIGDPLVEKILDKTGQKGTGKWTGISALEVGVPLTLIGESVFARCLSSQKNLRIEANKQYNFKPEDKSFEGDKKQFIKDLEKAVFAAKIISYAQGYDLIKTTSEEHNWDIKYGDIALLWRGGCIIRSAFLGKIKEAYDKKPQLSNLLLDDFFMDKLKDAEQSWRKITASALMNGIAVPTLASGLTYFDGIRTNHSAANLAQAQRDYFGAHTYERIDQPEGNFFHTNWTGRGGDTASTTYEV